MILLYTLVILIIFCNGVKFAPLSAGKESIHVFSLINCSTVLLRLRKEGYRIGIFENNKKINL
jgi:hypothetical protein